ncbi:uncharacterized protein LOC124871706 isoform X2 [Girardinichthys multiradiatus]|nr:uncharacterized protein LOC124871706 isoform X2 [Girardinichthys multiradiatus]
MFSLKQAALLVIHLLKIQNVFQVSATEIHRNMLVSSGDPVTFTCNISENSTVLIHWTSGRYYFTYSRSLNQTKSNFSSERVKIDSNIPSKLCIFRAQRDDAGLYTCTITDGGGYHKITWDLTVSKQEGTRFLKYVWFILSPAIGLLLCCITSAFCLCRRKNATGNQDLDLNNSRILSCVVYNVQLEEKAVPSQIKMTAM